MEVSRREFFAMLLAGGVMTAGGLWMPGRKLISIPRLVSSVNMTAAEVRLRTAAYSRMTSELLHRIIKPVMVEAIRDLAVYGSSVIHIESGKVSCSRQPVNPLHEIRCDWRSVGEGQGHG